MSTSPIQPPSKLRQTLRGAAVNLTLVAGAAFVLGALTLFGGTTSAGEQAVKLPEPAFDSTTTVGPAPQTAVFAGGCFWGVQAVFQHTNGVLNAVSGYAGGSKDTADYHMIGSGLTGHAESVEITYDPRQISYGKLLQIYFSVAHDPTELNRQGPDSGTQYRSAVFYQSDAQKEVTERYVAQLDAAHVFPSKIKTQITPLAVTGGFFPAEGYHQDYATLNPRQPYIARFDLPKLANLKRLMPELWREAPVLVSSQPKV